MFEYAAQLLLAVHRRLEASLPQKEKMERRVEDIRIVNRAKCLLIQYLHLSEEEAHRLIEKQGHGQTENQAGSGGRNPAPLRN